MTIVHKRIIYLSFIFVFFVLSPVLLLYASGFRYNFTRQVIQKTSALAIDSNPDKAQIWLNGKLYKDKTDTRVTTLLPQEYEVVVGKEGYFNWQRTVSLRASEARFLNQIQLFKKNIIPTYIGTLPSSLSIGFATSTSLMRNGTEIVLNPKLEFIELVSHSLTDDSRIVLTTLPKTNYEFVNLSANRLALKDTLNNILYIFSLDNDSSIKERLIISDVTDFDWLERDNKLVYYNDFELWTIDLNSGKKRLITRVSSGIDSAKWHPSGNYVIYQNKNKIKVVELVDSIDRQNYELIELSEIKNIVVNKKGDIIYLNATLGNQSGWFQMKIQ